MTEGEKGSGGGGTSALEILIAGGASALFFAAFLVVPLLGPLALPFAAVPIVRLAHRRGTAPALASSVVVALLVFLLGWASGVASSALGGSLFALAIAILPAYFAGSVQRGADASSAYLGLCAAGFALACGYLLAQPGQTDAAMQREIDRAFDQWLRVSSEPGRAPSDPDTAMRFRFTLDAARSFTKQFWIGLIGVTWVLGSAVGFYTGSWAARPAPSAITTHFDRLRVPAAVVALFAAAGAGWALLKGNAGRIAGNLLWPLAALYFVVGLSIICHFARRWFRARILRIGLYALIVYVPINVGVALLGVFDWYADFRRRGRQTGET